MTAPKFCSSCGAASDGERFCTHCGHQFIQDQTEPAGSTPQDTAAEPEPEPAATATAVREPDPPVQPPRSAPTAAPGPGPQGPPPQMPPSGSQVAEPRSGPPWLAFALSAGIIVVVAAVVAIVLLATSGSPGAKPKKGDTVAVQLTNTLLASRQLYAATPQPTYATLLPAGWTQVSSSDPNLTAAITVKSPVDQGATITVGQIAKPPKAFHAEAAAILTNASSKTGFHRAANSATTLAGGRAGWVLAYDAGGQSTVYYLTRSCNNMYAVAATVPPSRASVLRARIGTVASTLQGSC